MPTTKKLDNLNVNVLTKSQYDTAVAQGIITDEDLSMITDLGNDVVPQYEQMPVASADIVNQIVQYSGATGATYTNGYFYKCVSDGQNPATYSWELIDVQPSPEVIKVNSTITLAAANWSSNTQTVSVSGVTVDGVVFVSPVPASQVDYTSAGVMCSAQAAGTLTFTCDTVPSSDLSVTVVML